MKRGFGNFNRTCRKPDFAGIQSSNLIEGKGIKKSRQGIGGVMRRVRNQYVVAMTKESATPLRLCVEAVRLFGGSNQSIENQLKLLTVL
jgi:hypothetical protein